MTRRQRRGVLALAPLGLLGVLLLWGFSGIHPFGNFHGVYGTLLTQITVPQRHVSNVVGAVVFDYRGFDTLGEEFILFVAVTGVVLLLRADDEDQPEGEAGLEVESDTLRLFGVLTIGVGILVGLWTVAFGLVTPGGGFQGGVIVAAGLACVYLGVGYASWRRFARETIVEPLGAFGAGAYVAIGLAALIAAAPFLHNVLGPGKTGTLWSGGSMALLNAAVALEVAAANVTLFAQLLQRYVAPLGPGEQA